MIMDILMMRKCRYGLKEVLHRYIEVCFSLYLHLYLLTQNKEFDWFTLKKKRTEKRFDFLNYQRNEIQRNRKCNLSPLSSILSVVKVQPVMRCYLPMINTFCSVSEWEMENLIYSATFYHIRHFKHFIVKLILQVG